MTNLNHLSTTETDRNKKGHFEYINRPYVSVDLPSKEKQLITFMGTTSQKTFIPQWLLLEFCFHEDQLTIHVWGMIHVSVEMLGK